jgi:hypothetical protein
LAYYPSLATPYIDWDRRLHARNPLIAEQQELNSAAVGRTRKEHLRQLNPGQKHAFCVVTDAALHSDNKIFFLHGSGGTGKTFVYQSIINYVRSQSQIVLCVASSGIAALLLPGGQTAHSMFKLPIENMNSDSFCAIAKNSQRADLLRKTALVVWDEAGPQHRHAAQALDRTCRDICDIEQPFGGITVVFGGDYRQTLPVVLHGGRDDVVDACLQRSYIWDKVDVLHLTENMRLQSHGTDDDRDFAQWLLDIGRGSSFEPDIDVGSVDIPKALVTHDVEKLQNFVYNGIDSKPLPTPTFFLERSILAPRNADVDETNANILTLMDGDCKCFESADEILQEEGGQDKGADNQIPISNDFLRTIGGPSMAPGVLEVKEGCPLILLRNLSPRNGLCNGTRMVVKRASRRVLEVTLIGGDHDGEPAFIPRIRMNSGEASDIAFKFQRRQFPVRLAFAMSINKAQGQSLKYVGIDLRQEVFAHGQLYVALSRATSRSRLKLLLPEGTYSTKNVVYKDVLL